MSQTMEFVATTLGGVAVGALALLVQRALGSRRR